jgi:hypothetical protein
MKRYAEVEIEGLDEPPLELIAPRGDKSGLEEEYFQCCVCGFFYPKSKLTKVVGKWYCSKYNCVDDTRSNPKAGFPVQRGG